MQSESSQSFAGFLFSHFSQLNSALRIMPINFYGFARFDSETPQNDDRFLWIMMKRQKFFFVIVFKRIWNWKYHLTPCFFLEPALFISLDVTILRISKFVEIIMAHISAFFSTNESRTG